MAVAVDQAKAGRFLAFALADERYGVEILKVQEIIGVPKITSVPRCPEWMKGVVNLRGRIVPVVDLRLKFGIAPVPYDHHTCIIVVHVHRQEEKVPVGVIVDTVLEVIDLGANEIEPSPDYGTSVEEKCIIGLGKKDKDLTILLDIERALLDSGGAEAIQIPELLDNSLKI